MPKKWMSNQPPECPTDHFRGVQRFGHKIENRKTKSHTSMLIYQTFYDVKMHLSSVMMQRPLCRKQLGDGSSIETTTEMRMGYCSITARQIFLVLGLFDSYWILLTLEIVRNGVGLITTQPLLKATVKEYIFKTHFQGHAPYVHQRPFMEDKEVWTHEPEYDKFLHVRVFHPMGLQVRKPNTT